MDIISVYQYAEDHNIDVDWFTMQKAESLSIPLPDGKCAIALDPWKLETVAEEKVHLAHELGHCAIGGFYNRYAACDIRRKHENRADKWAIKKLIPEDELEQAVENGFTELWELAEYFEVTEDFMKKAMCLYKNGNLYSG